MSKPVVCVDLDGVLNLYDEWVAPEFFHPPRPGAREFLARLHESGYSIVVFTVRWHEWVQRWLEENDMARYVDRVTNEKPPAHVYLDDRAVCFRGDYDQALQQIRTFHPFWEPRA